jgi:RsiW-degrading membrane proteinase PrsW (M82 family)
MLFTLAAIVLGLLPGFAWLVFYLTDDPHPEPKRLIVFTFLAGIAFGFFAVVAEKLLSGAFDGWGVAELSVASLVCLALIEEFTKFAAAHFSISRTPEMSDPVDPMLYCIVAALGFATLENIGTLANGFTAGGDTLTALQTLLFRFVGATLLHSLTSGIVGYNWSLGIAKRRVTYFLVRGLVLATVAHAAFNELILTASNVGWAVLFLLVVGFFVLSDFEKLKAEE